MAQYLYEATVFFDTDDVLGVNVSQEATDTTDFETNYKDDCIVVSKVNLIETTFMIDKTYTQFKALITTPFDWADVKLVISDKHYDMYLLTSSPLQENYGK